jgi:regulator of sirC expression with transglutaminase-like and TPR domain
VIDLVMLRDSLPNVKIVKRAHLKYYYHGVRVLEDIQKELECEPSSEEITDRGIIYLNLFYIFVNSTIFIFENFIFLLTGQLSKLKKNLKQKYIECTSK